MRDLGGIGVDAVFERKSSLYSAGIASRPWNYYNFSEGNDDISATTRVPYAFTHYPVPHMADGYPLLMDMRWAGGRAGV